MASERSQFSLKAAYVDAYLCRHSADIHRRQQHFFFIFNTGRFLGPLHVVHYAGYVQRAMIVLQRSKPS